MKIILKHILKNIKKDWFRSLLIIFSLAIASAVFYVNINVYNDVINSSVVLFQSETKGYDLVVSGECDKFYVELPDALDQIELRDAPGLWYTGKENLEDEQIVNVLSCDLKKIVDEGFFSFNTTNNIDRFNEYDAIISHAKSKYYNVQVGDELEVYFSEKEKHTIKIVAVVESLGIFENASEDSFEIYVNNSYYSPNIIVLKLKDDSNLAKTYNETQDLNPELNVRYLYNQSGSVSLANETKKIISVILILVLLIAFFVITSTMKLIIEYRIPTMGIFRSVGATNLQINLILLLESAFYGLVGGISGSILGEVLRRILNAMYFMAEASKPNIGYLLMIPFFAVILNIVITSLSIVKVSKRSIKDIIFDKQDNVYHYPVLLGILGVILFGISIYISKINVTYKFDLLIIELILAIAGIALFCGLFNRILSLLLSGPLRIIGGGQMWLAAKNIAVSKIDNTSTILLVSIMSLVLVIYAGIGSLTTFFDDYGKNYPYEIMIKSSSKEASEYAYLNDIEGIDNIVYEYWDYNSESVNGKVIKECFVSINGYSNGITINEETKAKLVNGTAIIDEMFARINGFKIGDYLHFEGEHNFDIKVVGYCDSSIFNSSRSSVILTERDFFDYIEKSPAIIGISTSKPINEMLTKINDANYEHGDWSLSLFSKEQYVGREVQDAYQALKVASSIPIFVILLALLGLVNNQIISFVQKRKSYAVLYSTSMSKTQLRKCIVSELILSFISGCILGAILSSWLIVIMRDIIFATIAYIEFEITLNQIIISLLALFILLSITTIFPIVKLNKMNVVKEIKYE